MWTWDADCTRPCETSTGSNAPWCWPHCRPKADSDSRSRTGFDAPRDLALATSQSPNDPSKRDRISPNGGLPLLPPHLAATSEKILFGPLPPKTGGQSSAVSMPAPVSLLSAKHEIDQTRNALVSFDRMP